MTPKQLRAILKRTKLSQMEAGRVLGVTGRTVRKWIAGNTHIPPSSVTILNLIDMKVVTVEQIKRMTADA